MENYNETIFGGLNQTDETVDGYIESEHAGTMPFPVKRTLQINMLCRGECYYFRLADIVLLLDIVHPAKFVTDYRKFLGKKSIYKGVRTNGRHTSNKKTAYIEARGLLCFLKQNSDNWKGKYNAEVSRKIIAELEKIIEESSDVRG